MTYMDVGHLEVTSEEVGDPPTLPLPNAIVCGLILKSWIVPDPASENLWPRPDSQWKDNALSRAWPSNS